MVSTCPCRIMEGKAFRAVVTEGLFILLRIPCTQYKQSFVHFCLFTPLPWNKYCKWLVSHLVKPLVRQGTPSNSKWLLHKEKDEILTLLLTILFPTEMCRHWLWFVNMTVPSNVSWINWLTRNKIAMWDGLNWLIKDSVALIACIIVGKRTKGGGKKGRCLPEGPSLVSS